MAISNSSGTAPIPPSTFKTNLTFPAEHWKRRNHLISRKQIRSNITFSSVNHVLWKITQAAFDFQHDISDGQMVSYVWGQNKRAKKK